MNRYFLTLILSAFALCSFSQKKMDSTARKNAAKADVLIQKNNIYNKDEKPQVKEQENKQKVKQTSKKPVLHKRKHRKHVGKKKVKLIK